MPNWCYTSYVLEGNKEDINKVSNTLTELENRDKPAVENGFGTTWLGCLVHELGGDYNKIYCRGQWGSLQNNGDTLTLDTETAWGPMNEVFDFIKEKFPSIKYYFSSEEDGMCEYFTNDKEGKYFPCRYHINLCDPDDNYTDDLYFKTINEVFDFFTENYSKENPIHSEEDLDRLDDLWREQNDDAFINLAKVEVI